MKLILTCSILQPLGYLQVFSAMCVMFAHGAGK